MSHRKASFSSVALLVLAAGAAVFGADACGSTSTFVARPFDILVSLNSATPTNARDARIPLSWDSNHPQTIVVDLKVRDDSLADFPGFTGDQAWVLLKTNVGTLFNIVGPAGAGDPNVSGLSVKLTNGVLKGVTLQLVGAYGDVTVSASAIGYVPNFSTTTTPQCNDKIDNDGNGYADFLNSDPAKKDPNCYSQYDDLEGPFDAFFGSSSAVYFQFPTIADVRSSTPTPFAGSLVQIPGTPQHTIVVTRIASDGMYVTDIGGDPTKGNSLFVFNFNAPSNVLACDTLSRLAGTMSDFYGFTEMGTPAWSTIQWPGPTSGTQCVIPDFTELNVATNIGSIALYESGLVEVKNPHIGLKFGSKVPKSNLPEVGASNCDLNGDGVVGYSNGKAGYSPLEAACNSACDADNDCSEWNNFLKEAEVKIQFTDDATPPATHILFFNPSAAANYDLHDPKYLGPNIFQSIRGTIHPFLPGIVVPGYSLEPRCDDDIILVGAAASTVKTVQTACVHPRDGSDQEGSQ
ncbi:MAG: hypothetical protein ACHREM_29640 [Polyangiales bacterium]